jgi:hypothetical protein
MARRELLRVRLDNRERAALDQLAITRGRLIRSELVRRLIREANPDPAPAADPRRAPKDGFGRRA